MWLVRERRRGVAPWVLLVLAACLGPAPQARAQLQPNEWNPTIAEVRQLPPHCQGVFRKELDTGPNALALCGGWFNHYCPALVALHRAEQVTRPMTERRFFAQNAAQHLAYTRKHLAPTCPLTEDLRLAEVRARLLGMTLK